MLEEGTNRLPRGFENECIACGQETTFFKRKRLSDGSCICSNCFQCLPAPFKQAKYLTASEARDGVRYGKMIQERICHTFTATSQYGRVFLDEKKGLVAICNVNSVGKDGKLKHPISNIYYCLDIESVSFSMNPILHDKNKVTCKVIFTGYWKTGEIHIRETVKEKVTCQLYKGTGNTASWHNPESLEFFQRVYEQMIKNQLEKHYTDNDMRRD